MVYKFFVKLILILLFSASSFAVVLYDKNGLIITDIELKVYKELYLKNYNYEIKDTSGLKDLVLINNVIKDLKKNNIEFINKIDKDIINQYGKDVLISEIYLNFYRFSMIRNEFIYEYFRNDLSINEIIDIFKNLRSLNLPISENNCLVIKDILDLKNNTEFINNFFYNLKNNTKKFEIIINDIRYDVCINEKSFYEIEQLIVSYIKDQTEIEFENFVYEKTKN